MVDEHVWQLNCCEQIPDAIGGGVVVLLPPVVLPPPVVVVAEHWFELQSQFVQLPDAGFSQFPP